MTVLSVHACEDEEGEGEARAGNRPRFLLLASCFLLLELLASADEARGELEARREAGRRERESNCTVKFYNK